MDRQNAQSITAQKATEQLEFEIAHPEIAAQHEPQLYGVITDQKEIHAFLNWLVEWLSQKEEDEQTLSHDLLDSRKHFPSSL